MELNLAEEVVQRLRRAGRVAMLTGAGISAESNIPTFRDAQTGYWARFDPYELASPEGFAENPQRVWDWYRHRRKLVGSAEPNAGHYAVAQMERRYPSFTLITQNVDGLHARAGSKNMLTLHGTLAQVRCNADESHPHQEWLAEWDEEGAAIPLCECGAMLRPDVVWFGEMLDHEILEQAQNAAAASDVFFSVGTSSTVMPAAIIPLVAKDNGALLIEVNTAATGLTSLADVVLLGSAAQVLPQLLEVIKDEV